MKEIKVYVGRTVEDGLPRCWGRTMKDCEKAIGPKYEMLLEMPLTTHV